MKIISSFFRFVISLLKNFFKGIYAVIIFVLNLVKYLFLGIITIFEFIFIKPFTGKRKNRKPKPKSINNTAVKTVNTMQKKQDIKNIKQEAKY